MSEVSILSDDVISNKIFFIRNQKVMLDSDLALLYSVETKQLKRQVRRNIERFPVDFMFELTSVENEIVRSQIGTLEMGKYSKYLPMAFTEQGVAMLSSVLNSQTAIKVSIQIIRVFTKIRETLTDNLNIRIDIEEIKNKLSNQNKNIELIFNYLDELIEKQEDKKIERTKIGYKK